MLDNAFKHLLKAGFKIKLRKCAFFKEQIHYLDHLVSGTSILPPADKIEALMKLKPATNVKEVRQFLGLTGYYWIFICIYADIADTLNSLTHVKAQTSVWTPECQAGFNTLCLRLTNTAIVQLPDPNKPYLLFTDANKFYYSGVLTQASTADSNKAPLTSIESQTQDLQLSSNIIHPEAYILVTSVRASVEGPWLQKNASVYSCQ